MFISDNIVIVDGLHLQPSSLDGQHTYFFNLMAGIASSGHDNRSYFMLANYDILSSFQDHQFAHRASLVLLPSQILILRIFFQQIFIPLFIIYLRFKYPKSRISLFSPAYISSTLCPPGINVIVAIHDMYHILFPREISPLRAIYWNFFVFLSCLRASTIVAVSKNTAADISRFYPFARSKIAVIYESGHHHSFMADVHKTINSDVHPIHLHDKYFLSIGSTKRIKDPFTLLSGFSMSSESKNHNLLVTGPLTSKFSKSLMEYSLRCNRIKLLGTVSASSLSLLIKSAEAIIISSFYEGFCLPALEGQAAGKIIICPRIPVLVEILGKSAIFYQPGDPHSLSSALREFHYLTDHQLLSLKQISLANSRRFSWTSAADLLLSFI